jgi:D-alanine-D-alanine ligase
VNRKNITILYNKPALPPSHPAYEQEAGVLESVAAFRTALIAAGHAVSEFALADSLGALIDEVAARRPDVIVNFCEEFGGTTAGEIYVAGLLETFKIPYTGSPPECLALGRDKARAKWLLAGAGLPTAPFVRVNRGEPLPEKRLTDWLAEGPLFVKPASEDASLGIDHDSVVSDLAALQRQTATILDRFGAALIERYIDGREFNISVVALPELQVLPLAEIEFQVGPGQLRWPIVTYQGKWDMEGLEDRATPARCPADVEPMLAEATRAAAAAAFRLLGCRDYARVDMRVDRAGRIFILEVNANPDAGPRAGFAKALRVAGIEYNEFARRLVATAVGRAGWPAQI